ncbi:solute carrier organic anion transporter family member 4A1-like [Dermacentor variabilis]|uniref:solute carrier organic anion transporter family member 4A1-like n=1 Tax=Dermacentor variabilis TaxID=34621 RepID=UPI003F5B444F
MSSLPTAKFAADVGQSSSSLSTQGHYQDVCVPPADVAPPPEPARKISLTQLPYIKHARERDERCGWCWFRPDFLLKLRHPRYVLLALCCMVFLQGFVANGLVYMVLPTLERRFELKSLEAGTIVAMYHLASCISAPLVTLVAARRSKPLYLAMSAVVIGIGTMVIVLPHFMAPHYIDLPGNVPPRNGLRLCTIGIHAQHLHRGLVRPFEAGPDASEQRLDRRMVARLPDWLHFVHHRGFSHKPPAQGTAK